MEKHNLKTLYELDREICSRLSRLIADYYILHNSEESLSRFVNKGFQGISSGDSQFEEQPFAGPSEVLDEAYKKLGLEGEIEKTNDVRDFRIKSLSVKNFRRFPETDIPFGINMSRDGIPKSLVLVGGNGEGKSSLYAALEYILCGTIGEAKLRNYDFRRFASHSESADADLLGDIKVQTYKQKTFQHYREFKEALPVPGAEAFFCSEWDIVFIGQSRWDAESGSAVPKYAFHNFFAENLGFKDLVDLKKELLEMMKEEYPDVMELKNRTVLCKAQLKEYNEVIAVEKKRLSQFREQSTSEIQSLSESKSQLVEIKKDILRLKRKNSKSKLFKLKKDEVYDEADNQTKIGWFTRYLDDMVVIYIPMQKLIDLFDNFESVIGSLDCKERTDSLRNDVYRLKNLLEEIGEIEMGMDDDKPVFEGAGLKRAGVLPFLSQPSEYFGKFDLPGLLNKSEKVVVEIIKLLDEKNGTMKLKYTDLDFDELVRLSVLAKRKEEEIEDLRVQSDLLSGRISLQEELGEYCKKLDEYLGKEVNEAFSLIKDTVSQIMEYFLSFRLDKEKIEISFVENKVCVQICYDEYGEGSSGRKECRLSPQKYYNTFRYKLFCMVLKISVALAIMKRFRINFPIVLDDLFYASDYDNRELIALFMDELHKNYRKVFPESTGMQLQLICFTHDELVVDAMLTATKTMLWKERDNFIFGRLVDYKGLMSDNESKGMMRVQKDGMDFYNLYIELFK